jgi:hypothetical protein
MLECRPAELPDQHDARMGAIDGKDRRAIADVVRFARLALPLSVTAAKVEFGLAQHIVIVRKDDEIVKPDPGSDIGPLPIVICHFGYART